MSFKYVCEQRACAREDRIRGVRDEDKEGGVDCICSYQCELQTLRDLQLLSPGVVVWWEGKKESRQMVA